MIIMSAMVIIMFMTVKVMNENDCHEMKRYITRDFDF